MRRPTPWTVPGDTWRVGDFEHVKEGDLPVGAPGRSTQNGRRMVGISPSSGEAVSEGWPSTSQSQSVLDAWGR